MAIAPLPQTARSPTPGAYVVLYDIDATRLGGGVYRYTPSANGGVRIRWRGNPYDPFPIESEGWEWNGRGTLPTPRIRVANANRVLGGLVVAFGDLLGCTVTRWRVFDRYLDDGPDPDPNAHMPVDVYRIERKSAHTAELIEWELAAAMDHEGRSLPGRLVLQNTCPWRYRIWSQGKGAFDYTLVQCPYNGTDFFTREAVRTDDPAQDVCGKHLSDCEARYGETGVKPFGGFPGVARARI